MATLGGPPAVTLAPARRDLGTNLVASRPAGVIPYLFGRESFRRHLAAARGRGLSLEQAKSSITLDAFREHFPSGFEAGVAAAVERAFQEKR